LCADSRNLRYMKEYDLTAKSADAGARIDTWVAEKLQFSRKRVKQLLDNGKILVNHRRVVIAGWELEEGDHIQVRVPKEIERVTFEEERAGPAREQRRPSQDVTPAKERVRRSAFRNIGTPSLSYQKEISLKKQAEQRQQNKQRTGEKKRAGSFRVYHHDKHIIVVDKAAGILTVPQKGSDHPHLVAQIKRFLKRKHRGAKHSFVKPVHRLDSETSGLVVMALSHQGEVLEKQFAQHSIRRTYQAVVHGRIEKENGTINKPLEKGEFGQGKKVRASEHGKKALTEYSVSERYKKATLVDVSVSTGRTHQVRVHFQSIGHPLVGDKLYHDGRHHDIPFGRHALHATSLGFRHPATGKRMTFKSPLPEDMKALIDSLRST
jgi:23S rRNA pseudouridine1911/1915/1917 synthase